MSFLRNENFAQVEVAFESWMAMSPFAKASDAGARRSPNLRVEGGKFTVAY
jgi:hypothetical protein